jgi:hypothetical protein
VAGYRNVLPRRPLQIRPGEPAELLALIGTQALWVEMPPYEGKFDMPDPTDRPFVARALAAGCPGITGDAKDFPAELGARVMTVSERVGAQR